MCLLQVAGLERSLESHRRAQAALAAALAAVHDAAGDAAITGEAAAMAPAVSNDCWL